MSYQLLNLPPVSQMMKDSDLEPKKQFGQNFLFDLNLTRKIARSIPNLENMTVLEVGPGPGGLTRALLECGAKKIIAIEKDKTTKPILDQIIAVSSGRLEVLYEDALKVEGWRLEGEGNVAICSNLPYNIGTELLISWLHQIINHKSEIINSMTLMFQREVATRIVAKAGDKQYGRLSVLTSLTADAKILFNIPNTAFYPAPKVQSAVVQIIPKKNNAPIEKVEKLTAILFGQRRKMIRSIMKDVNWSEFGLTGTERAEELNPVKFAEIAGKIMI